MGGQEEARLQLFCRETPPHHGYKKAVSPPHPRSQAGGIPYRCRPRRPPGTGGRGPIYCRSTGSGPATAAGSRTGKASCRAACGRRRVAGGAPRSPACGTARSPPACTRCCRTPCSTCRGRRLRPGRHNRPGPRRAATPGALRAEDGAGDALPAPCLIPLPNGAQTLLDVRQTRHVPDPPEHTTPASSLWLQSCSGAAGQSQRCSSCPSQPTSSRRMGPLPRPKAAPPWTRTARPHRSCRHTTSASARSQASSHTVPQAPSCSISTRPSHRLRPPASRSMPGPG